MTLFHKLAIKDVRRETPDAISVAFDLPAHLAADYKYVQGQHLTLKSDIDGQEVRRSYSICQPVGAADLRVAIKSIDGGVFSNYAHENFTPGLEVDVMVPEGRFFTELDEQNAKSYLAFAAGSGITPVMSILQTVLQTEKDSHFTLIYGNRTRDDILFREQLEDLKNIYLDRLTVVHVLSREQQDVDLFNGRITAEKCRDLARGVFDPMQIDEVFLCGPEEMIEQVRAFLQQAGIPAANIHFELFITKAALAGQKTKRAASGAGQEKNQVTVIVDGRATTLELETDGQSILDAALAAGADLPYSCKGGVCCTCRAKIVEGEAAMDVNYALEDDEVAAGYILTCQSHPRSSKLVVDYDQR